MLPWERGSRAPSVFRLPSQAPRTLPVGGPAAHCTCYNPATGPEQLSPRETSGAGRRASTACFSPLPSSPRSSYFFLTWATGSSAGPQCRLGCLLWVRTTISWPQGKSRLGPCLPGVTPEVLLVEASGQRENGAGRETGHLVSERCWLPGVGASASLVLEDQALEASVWPPLSGFSAYLRGSWWSWARGSC